MSFTRIPAIFAPAFLRLLSICAGASWVYIPDKTRPTVHAFGTLEPLRSRAHQLLALELCTSLRAGERDFESAVVPGSIIKQDQAFRDLQNGASVAGGEAAAMFYAGAAGQRYRGYGSGPQTPNPTAYALNEVMAGAAQLDADMAASAAADVALDPALAALALLPRDAAMARYHGYLTNWYPQTSWFP